MKTRYIFLAIAALAISACARNTEPSEPEGVQMTFTAYQEGSEMTRTTVQSGGTQVYWEPSDEIKVFFNGASGRFVSQNTENATAATFTGTISVIAGANEGGNANYTTWGLYPYRSDATSDGLSVTTTLPAEQTGRSGSFAKNTNITLAQSAGLNLAFYNVCGGLRFSLTQEGIKRVTFQGNSGEAIAGKIKIAFADGIPVVQEVSEGESVITLTAPNGGTFQTGQWYYISAIPGSLSSGYKIVFYKESESAKLTSSSSVTFRRGVFGSLADADEDLVFKPSSSGDEPNPDDVIQFADPIAKYACVEKFDTNGDGEVSYAEAAAATSLSGLFMNWNTVTSFDEIRYFTGVTSTEDVFDGLTKLTHITIPDHIITLGTFSGCTSLGTVILPATLSKLPYYCFSNCSALSDVTLPTGITYIPPSCFANCTALRTLNLPNTVIGLREYAFSGCTQLTGLDLPSGLTTIGNHAFEDCRSLSLISFPSSLTTIRQYAFSGCRAISTVTIGDGVSIEKYAFNNCVSLISAFLGNNVTLDQFVFNNCALVSVVLPDNLSTIPNGCFKNCGALSSITWPRTLTSIGDQAFFGCRFVDADYTVELPATVTSIGSAAFGYVHHLVVPSTTPVNIASDSFIQDYTYIYVPANMVDMYKVRTNWSNYADRIWPISDYPATPKAGGTVGEAIDLGLSVKWASWNIGASAPIEYGAYFSWGETTPKWNYDWSNYRWCSGSETSLCKYNNNSEFGIIDNKTLLDLEDDAAHINWGGNWRTPTLIEMQELLDNCTASWDILHDGAKSIYGVRFTSNKEGYTDISIFLPAAGYRSGESTILNRSSGLYWSTSISISYPNLASYLSFDSGGNLNSIYGNDRYCGLTIRPVCD